MAGNRFGRFTSPISITFKSPFTSDDTTYFFSLISDYHLLITDVENEGARQLAADTITKSNNPENLNWQDIHAMEKVLLSLAPYKALQRYAWNLRARYRDMVGPDVYLLYVRSKPPEPDLLPAPTDDEALDQNLISLTTVSVQPFPNKPEPGSDLPAALPSKRGQVRAVETRQITRGGAPPNPAEAENLLRADLLLLLRETQWVYTYWPTRERTRNKLNLYIAILGVAMVLVAFYVYVTGISTNDSGHITTITLVAVCGVIGGCLSTLGRLYRMPKGVHMVNLYELNLAPLNMFLAPISGGIFAIVLYLIFMGGLVDGALFPKMALMSRPSTLDVENVRQKTSKALDKAANSKAAADKMASDTASADSETMTSAAKLQNLAKQHANAAAVMKVQAASLDSANRAAERRRQHIRAMKQAAADKVVADAAAAKQSEVENAANSVTTFSWPNLNQTEPASIPDYGKLLVWAFIAGFGERFVPDMLQRLIGKSDAIKGNQRR